MELLEQYFSELNVSVKNQLGEFCELIKEWNGKINLISRKDSDQIEERHLLPSLAFLKVVNFLPGTRVMDVGTGGGFPGIPLAICCPQVDFYLVDSVGKKIKVIEAIVEEMGLTNVYPVNARVEAVDKEFDFILGRAVTNLPTFLGWVRGKVRKGSRHEVNNGVLYLKGGELEPELEERGIRPNEVYQIKDLLKGLEDQGKYITYFSDF